MKTHVGTYVRCGSLFLEWWHPSESIYQGISIKLLFKWNGLIRSHQPASIFGFHMLAQWCHYGLALVAGIEMFNRPNSMGPFQDWLCYSHNSRFNLPATEINVLHPILYHAFKRPTSHGILFTLNGIATWLEFTYILDMNLSSLPSETQTDHYLRAYRSLSYQQDF